MFGRARLPSSPDHLTMDPATVTRELCLACGLCCNGVLFRDVELQPADDRLRLAAAGLLLKTHRHKVTFPQPCQALCADLRCRIYADRPARCHDFECALFKAVASEAQTTSAALKIIRSARQRAEQVRKLLVRAGDTDDTRPISLRFKRVQRRCESGALGVEAVDAFGELTLAVHALKVILSTHFYPGEIVKRICLPPT